MAQYSYIGLFGEVVVIADSDINFRGAWSGTTSYALKDAANYNGRWFIAVTAHTGVTPPTVYIIETPTYWSPLVLTEGDPEILDTNSEIVASRAESNSILALSTSWAGTDAAAAARDLAATGTEAADQAYALATLALDTAWTGTDAAAAAMAEALYNTDRTTELTVEVGTAANRLDAIEAIFSVADAGTHVFFVAASRGGPTDVEIGILGGVVTSFVQT